MNGRFETLSTEPSNRKRSKGLVEVCTQGLNPSGKPMIPHLLCCEAPQTKTRGGFPVRMLSFSDSSPWPHPKVGACGKPAGQGIGGNDYSLTLELVERDALHLQHPRLLQCQG
jgi:hypothetical protein